MTVMCLLNDKPYIQRLTNATQRGRELVLCFDEQDISMEDLFSRVEYYKVNENIAKMYLY